MDRSTTITFTKAQCAGPTRLDHKRTFRNLNGVWDAFTQPATPDCEVVLGFNHDIIVNV
jgi:hypothetical protein